MAYQKFQLVYTGTLADNWVKDEVSAALAELFKCHPEKLLPLFSGKRVIVKKNLTKTQARDLRLAMRRAGAIAEFEPMPSLIAVDAIPRPPVTGRSATPPPATNNAHSCCPKCGQRQTSTVSCSSCGVIFAKYQQQQRRQIEQQAAIETPSRNLKPATGSRPVDTDVIPKRYKLPIALLVLLAIGGYFFNDHQQQLALQAKQLAWRMELNQPGIRELTIDQVDSLQQLSAQGRYTVVDLFDSTCETCTMMHKGQKTLLANDASVAIRRIDITDDHIRHQLYHKLNLSGGYAMPLTVVFAPDGTMVAMDKPGRPWANQLGKQAFIKMVKKARGSA